MSKLIYINASPRGDQSAAVQAGQVFLDALPASVEVQQIDLFDRDLPEVTLEITSAKQKAFINAELTDAESEQWRAIVELVDEFKSADSYLFAMPMWNFTVPYRFKQYIDLITHPGLTFTRDENGPRGLASGVATVIYSRGGDYAPKDGKPDPFDFQSPYFNAWCTLVGLGPVNEVLVQRTMAGPDVVGQAIEAATAQLQELAAAVG